MKKIINKRALLFITMATLGVTIALAQQQTVTGNITDAKDGSAMIGVNVVIKGTTTGTVTNSEGVYSIDASPEDVLQFSSVGYQSQDITVGSQTRIDVSMEQALEELEELVVVGYGYTKKSDLTGSIVSLKSEDLTVRPVSRIDYALQGKAAGVQVTNTSGMPGSGASIRIRGHGSLMTTNSPLWVIDGYIGGDINSVSPEDIESVEILKDASSTAIYGARGGNGVILVTTKRGAKNQNKVDFSYYHQISRVSKTIDLLDREGYCTLRNRALTNAGLPEQFTQGQINGTEPIDGYYADTDWQDVIFRPAHTNYYNLSVSGGGDRTTYALSVNHRSEEGIIYDSDFTRSGIRLNLDHEFTDRMKIGVSTNVYRTVSDGFNVTTGWSLGAAGGAITSFPYYPVYVYDTEEEYYNLSTWDNPRFQAEGQKNNSLTTSLFGKIFYTWEIVDGLTLQADVSGDYNSYQNNQFVTAELFGATATRGLARGQITDRATDRWIGTLLATYETDLAENHALKVMVGAEQQVVNSTGNSMFSEDIDRESFLWYNMGAFLQANHSISSYKNGSVFKSVFGRIDYNFLNRYIVEVTVRRDGSSKFGPEDKWGTFPSASAAWKLSEEDFIKNLGIFDQLRLRVSWGVSGNDNIALYQWLPNMQVGFARSSYVFGAAGSSGGDMVYVGAAIGTIPNESVHWEESATTDIGLDMGFFRNRLRLVVDLYNRTTSELLWNYPLPLYTGYGDGWSTGTGVSIVSNVAEMNNRGIELGLGADILATGNFRWTVNFNISKNLNKVVNLAEDTEFFAGITKVEPDQPIGNIWGFITDGIFQEGDDIENTPRFTGDEGVGDQRFVDANDNGILTDQDRGVIGSALPNFIYGLSTSLSYKGFELSAILNGVQGVDMYNGSLQTLSNGTIGEYNGGAWLWDSWTPENPNTDIPKMSDSYVDKVSDRFVEDASFLRLSNVQLSYAIPTAILTRVHVKNCRVYVSLQNYLTLTNYSGYDPEMHSGGNSNLSIGFDSQNYPSPKSITFGVQLGL